MKTISLLLMFAAVAAPALGVKVWPDKLWVKPGEPVTLTVTVDQPGAVVACRVVHHVDTVAATFTGKPDADGKVAFTFTPTEPWGYEAVATAIVGETTAVGSEVFAGAANPFAVAVDWSVPEVYGQDVLPDGSAAPEGPVRNPHLTARIAHEVARFRHQYLAVGELMGPAYCSFSNIVPPVPNYFKAHHYNYSANALRELIADLHANGICTVMYVNACASGLAGTEFVRQHPEYVAYSPDGTPFGGLDLSTMAVHQWYVKNYPESLKQVQEWQREKPRPTAVTPNVPGSLYGTYPGFLNCWLDFEDPEVARIGARKIIEGQEYYGYDGVRYDGEYRVPSIGDPLAPSRDFRNWQGKRQIVGPEAERLTARNLRNAFDMLRDHDPDFLIGLNHADFRSDTRGDAMLESPILPTISPGVWILDEVAKGALSPSHPEHHWADFIDHMSAQADRTRRVGNFLFAGWGGGPGHKAVDTRQVKAIAWACGLRWIPGGYSKEQWFLDVKRDYNRFALRYSQYLLDNDLQRLTPEAAAAAVQVSGSRPVLWDQFVHRLPGRYLVVNLVNQPLEKVLTEDAQEPPPATAVAVTFAADVALGTVHVVSPEFAPLTPAVDNRTVTVPRIGNWAMVIVEP